MDAPVFFVEPALDPGIKNAGGIPRLLEVPLFEGTDIFISRDGRPIQVGTTRPPRAH